MRLPAFRWLAPLLLTLQGCAADRLTVDQRDDPASCAPCHARAVAEWEGSMHAYASADPVFRALQAKGQRETDGALGTLCITCHAPLVARRGLSDDGLDLDDLPATMQGVGCSFCHEVASVQAPHNNAVTLAGDGVLRGGFDDPVSTPAHDSACSPLHDRSDLRSSELCGACHDVVLPNGLHLEQTHLEWSGSVFAAPGPGALSCGACHMRGRDGFGADVEGAKPRRLHDHAMPGVDLAVSPFPWRSQQRALVQDELDTSLLAVLGVTLAPGGVEVSVTLENVAAGHGFPSGAAHNRRVWVQLEAFAGGARVFASGVVGEDEAAVDHEDASMWLLRDVLYGEGGAEVQHTWEAVTMEKRQLAPARTADPTAPHAQTRAWFVPGLPDRVRMEVRLRPLAFEVAAGLVASGDLDPDVLDALPTFTLGSTVKEWRPQ